MNNNNGGSGCSTNAIGCLAFILLGFVGYGNAMMIVALTTKSSSVLSEDGSTVLAVFIGILADVLLIGFLLYKFGGRIKASFLLAKNGIDKHFKMKKKSADIKRASKSVDKSISELQELRAIGIDKNKTLAATHFCDLIDSALGNDKKGIFSSAIGERKDTLERIALIENNIIELADKYREIGNQEKADYYLKIANSNKNKYESFSAKKNTDDQIIVTDKEKKAIKIWTTIFASVLSIIILIASVLLIKNIPYMRLRSMIRNQSLTADLCDDYKEYFHTEKGYELLASELTRFHNNGEAENALWLLSIQPDCINGYNVSASNSFIDWIVEYAKKNGQKKDDDLYAVGKFEVEIYILDDIKVSDGVNYSRIENGESASHIIE